MLFLMQPEVQERLSKGGPCTYKSRGGHIQGNEGDEGTGI